MEERKDGIANDDNKTREEVECVNEASPVSALMLQMRQGKEMGMRGGVWGSGPEV